MDVLERRLNQQEIEQAYIMFLEENDIFIKGEISYEYGLYLAAKRFSANGFGLTEVSELGKNLLENLNNSSIIVIGDGKICKGPYFGKKLPEEKSEHSCLLEAEREKLLKILSSRIS